MESKNPYFIELNNFIDMCFSEHKYNVAFSTASSQDF